VRAVVARSVCVCVGFEMKYETILMLSLFGDCRQTDNEERGGDRKCQGVCWLLGGK